jgi:hypothetical protein
MYEEGRDITGYALDQLVYCIWTVADAVLEG